MKAERHRQIAERIERSVALCHDDDWEIQIEAAMLAGTHWANYALHQHGVALQDEDIVHTSMLVVNTVRKYKIVEAELITALEEIEELRPLYVRGDVAGGPEAGRRALDLLGTISAQARKSDELARRGLS